MLSEQRRFRVLATLSQALMLAGSACAGDATEPGLFRDVVSTEIAVDPMPVYVPTPGRWPAVAFDGTQYLVVWEDHRMRRPILYGGRIAADGSSLDPLGFPILDVNPLPAGPSPSQVVVVAAGDGNFLAVTPVAGQLRGVRISAAGEVLDPEGIVIATLLQTLVSPSLIFDGEQYLVAWVDGAWPWVPGPDNGVYWARLKPDGTVLDPDGVQIVASGGWASRAGLSFDGTNYLLSWTSTDPEGPFAKLEAARVAPDGTWIDQTPIRINPEGVQASTSYGFHGDSTAVVGGFDGQNHVIVWQGLRLSDLGFWHSEILTTRLTPDGVILDPDGLVAFPDSGDWVSVHRLDMAAGDGRSVVVFSTDYTGAGAEADHIEALHITADGTLTNYPEEALPRGLEATVAVHSGGGLLIWREGDHRREDYPAIVGTRIEVTGIPVADGQVIPAMPASRQEVKAAASDGENFFVVWSDTREPKGHGRALFGARIGPGKIPLDLEPIQINSQGTQAVNVVFDGANFLVTWARKVDWNDHYPFNTVRVSPTGELLDAAPLQLPLDTGSHVNTLAAASDGERTIFVGVAHGFGWDGVLGAVLVDQDLAVASEVIPLTHQGEGLGYDEAVSHDGSGYLVSWTFPPWVLGQAQILGRRISSDGTPMGERFTIIARDQIHHMAVAAGGGVHLVVWQEQGEIWATRVSEDGQVLDPDGRLVAVTAPNLHYKCVECVEPELNSANYTAVAFDGEDFIVAWRAPATADDLSSLDLYAAKLSPDGEVLKQFPISQAPGREGPPILAGADGRVLAAYARFVPGEAHDTRRALARVLVSDIDLAPDVDLAGSTQSGESADDTGDSPADVQSNHRGCRITTDKRGPTTGLLLLVVVVLARRRLGLSPGARPGTG